MKIPQISADSKILSSKEKLLENGHLLRQIWTSNSLDSPLSEYQVLNVKPWITFQFTINANHFLIIENTLDPFHTPFIHKGFVRSPGFKTQIDVLLNKTPSSVEAIFLNEGKQSGFISQIFGHPEDVGIGRYIHPGILQLEYRRKEKTLLLFTAYLTAVSSSRTLAKIEIQMENWLFKSNFILIPFTRALLGKIIQQDIKICELQQSNLSYFPHAHFTTTKLDYMYPLLKDILDTDGAGFGLTKQIRIEI